MVFQDDQLGNPEAVQSTHRDVEYKATTQDTVFPFLNIFIGGSGIRYMVDRIYILE